MNGENDEGTNQIARIDFGPDFDKEVKMVGGEMIIPTAKIGGESDGKNAEVRGWLSAMTRARSNESCTLVTKKQNLQEIVDAAVIAGVTKKEIQVHLEQLGIKVMRKEDIQEVSSPIVSVSEDETSGLVDEKKQAGIALRHADLLLQPGTYLHRASIENAESINNGGLRVRGVGFRGHVSPSGSTEKAVQENFCKRHVGDTAVLVIELVPGRVDIADEWAIGQYQKSDGGDFIFPSTHIKGYINRLNGEFVTNQNYIPLTDEEKNEANQIDPQGFIL